MKEDTESCYICEVCNKCFKHNVCLIERCKGGFDINCDGSQRKHRLGVEYKEKVYLGAVG